MITEGVLRRAQGLSDMAQRIISEFDEAVQWRYGLELVCSANGALQTAGAILVDPAEDENIGSIYFGAGLAVRGMWEDKIVFSDAEEFLDEFRRFVREVDKASSIGAPA